MKVIVLILYLCFMNGLCVKAANDLDTTKVDDTFISLTGFMKDSLVFYVNDTLLYAGYIGDKEKGYSDFFYYIKHSDEVSFRVILYKNQNDFKEFIEQKTYPPKYNEQPNMDFKMTLNNNSPPENIYFTAGFYDVGMRTSSIREDTTRFCGTNRF